MKILNHDPVDIIATIISVAIIAVVVGALLYGAYYATRWVNNELYYKGATEEMVCKMVQPKYLKEGYCK